VAMVESINTICKIKNMFSNVTIIGVIFNFTSKKNVHGCSKGESNESGALQQK